MLVFIITLLCTEIVYVGNDPNKIKRFSQYMRTQNYNWSLCNSSFNILHDKSNKYEVLYLKKAQSQEMIGYIILQIKKNTENIFLSTKHALILSNVYLKYNYDEYLSTLISLSVQKLTGIYSITKSEYLFAVTIHVFKDQFRSEADFYYNSKMVYGKFTSNKEDIMNEDLTDISTLIAQKFHFDESKLYLTFCNNLQKIQFAPTSIGKQVFNTIMRSSFN